MHCICPFSSYVQIWGAAAALQVDDARVLRRLASMYHCATWCQLSTLCSLSEHLPLFAGLWGVATALRADDDRVLPSRASHVSIARPGTHQVLCVHPDSNGNGDPILCGR